MRILNALVLVTYQLIGLQAAPLESVANNRQLHGVIEIGSSGIRALVCRIDNSTEAQVVTDIIRFTPRDTKPLEPSALSATVQQTVEIAAAMTRDHGVAKNQVHLVGSSGLSEAPGADQLRAEVTSAVGRQLNYISVKDEIKLTLKGIAGSNDLSTVTVVDIGGGNTKATYYKLVDGRGYVDTVRLSDGVRALSSKAGPPTPAQDYLARLAEIEKSEVKPALQSVVNNNPAFANRPVLYLSGGVSWVLASSLAPPDSRPGEGTQTVELRAKEIATWIEQVLHEPRSAYNYRGDRVSPAGKQFAEENKRSIEANFSPAQLAAGATLLRSLQEVLEFSNRQRIVFHRDSLYAWPRAYLVEILKEKN